MHCICQIFGKNKCQSKTHSYTEFLGQNPEKQELISASEVSRLKAEVWFLRNSLEDSIHANNNMQELVKGVVQEKYDVLEELQKLLEANRILEAQLKTERDIYAEEKKAMIEEINHLKTRAKDDATFIDQVVKSNIELKTSLLEANETIYKMGLIYLKKKFTSPSITP